MWNVVVLLLMHLSLLGASDCVVASYVFVKVYIGIGAKAPDIPLYDDGQYRVAAQYRHALYIQSRIVSHWLEHIQLSYFTSNKLESKANKTR
jgi:hypothetical protein